MSPSARNLILANFFTLVLAIVFEWQVGWLMWPVWVQTVVIGVFAWRRLMGLRAFSTRSFLRFELEVPETTRVKRWAANVFIFHYGAFVASYLVFLLLDFNLDNWLEWLLMAATGLSFILSQRETYAVQRTHDLAGKPDLLMLSFLPYLRMMPLYLLVGFIGPTDSGVLALSLFMLLKTAADVALDYADRRLAGAARQKPADET